MRRMHSRTPVQPDASPDISQTRLLFQSTQNCSKLNQRLLRNENNNASLRHMEHSEIFKPHNNPPTNMNRNTEHSRLRFEGRPHDQRPFASHGKSYSRAQLAAYGGISDPAVDNDFFPSDDDDDESRGDNVA
jgi:hypothetical protein